jgi:hypothetical protein
MNGQLCTQCNDIHPCVAVATAVSRAVKALTKDACSLTILRNGGWEQWFRNLLLVELQTDNQWGFTEANDGDTRRVDLMIRCKGCPRVILSIEIKTNYVSQGPAEIKKRFHEAIGQVRPFTTSGVPSFIVYLLTHLRGDKRKPLVIAQKSCSPGYKYFDTRRSAWPEHRYPTLPDDAHLRCDIANGDEVSAEVRAWVIETTHDIAAPQLPQLHYLDCSGNRIVNPLGD